ncbi:MAG: zinc ribbon domain-containing protein [Clostridia bacterium]|nr:zinc ribbon domain-containing protein [Clostridia bacterium]
MKQCNRCGFTTDDDANFCPKCGNALSQVKRCPYCGSVTTAESNFCPSCGARISGMPAPSPNPPAYQQAPVMPMPAAAPDQVLSKPSGDKRGNKTAGVIKFLPAILLIIFSAACFISFLGSGFSFYNGYETIQESFFNTLARSDLFDVMLGEESGNPFWIMGIVLIAFAALSLIIGCRGFGMAARSKAGDSWTKAYRRTLNWGIVMYVFTLAVAAVYSCFVLNRVDLQFEGSSAYSYYSANIEMSLGAAPVAVMIACIVGIIGSIVFGVLKRSASKKYGNLDSLAPDTDIKMPATSGVRRGYYWTVLGSSLLFFIFAALLLVLFRGTLINKEAAGYGGNLYDLLSDDNYGLSTSMWVLGASGAFCLLVGLISVLVELGRRKKTINAVSRQIKPVKRTLFCLFLYCLVLGAIGYAYGKLCGTGLLYEASYLSEWGIDIMGPMLTNVTALTIVCLAITIILLILQCAVFNTHSFEPSAPAPAGPAAPVPMQPMYYGDAPPASGADDPFSSYPAAEAPSAEHRYEYNTPTMARVQDSAQQTAGQPEDDEFVVKPLSPWPRDDDEK